MLFVIHNNSVRYELVTALLSTMSFKRWFKIGLITLTSLKKAQMHFRELHVSIRSSSCTDAYRLQNSNKVPSNIPEKNPTLIGLSEHLVAQLFREHVVRTHVC